MPEDIALFEHTGDKTASNTFCTREGVFVRFPLSFIGDIELLFIIFTFSLL